MRFPLCLSRRFRWLTALAAVALCSLLSVGSALAQTTTITGTVYAPNTTDPLPNILVFVATPGVAVQPFQTGPGSCANPNDAVTGQPLVQAITDYKGNFTLSSAALDALGSTTVNLVIQAGKWRRQYLNTPITTGVANPQGNLVMPSAASTSATSIQDLPKIAVVTGSADPVECVLQSMGLANGEVTDISGTGHINFFSGTQSPGAKASSSSTTTELQLMTTPSLLNTYDMVILGCQGSATDSTVQSTTIGPTNQQNLASYANNGGRIFATHFEYIWLNKANTFAGAAQWRTDAGPSLSPSSASTGTITVDTSYPEGVTLANWLQYINASPSGTAGYGQITGVGNIREDQTGVIAPTQSWGTLNPPYSSSAIGTPVMQFTFDTPLGTSGVPAVSLAFTNNSSSFVQGDTSDSVTINVTNTSTTATSSGLTLTVVIPTGTGLTPVSIAGTNTNTGWQCTLSSLQCIENFAIAPGASDPVTVVFSIAANATVGNTSISGSLANGGLSNSGQCGRVLYNDYHVEASAKTATAVFPGECPVPVNESPAEKFLEFSLYNLSNFVAPVTSDSFVIEGTTTANFAALASSSIFYGQTITAPASVTTASSGAVDGGSLDFTINGTQVCQISATTGGSCPTPVGANLDVLPSPGTYTLQWSYTGDTDYEASTSTSQSLTVNPDPTTTTLTSSINPAVGGQNVTYTATVADAYATAVGNVTFYDGTNVIGNVPLNSSGVATLTLSDIPVGNRLLTATFNPVLNAEGAYNFITSTSGVLTEIITIPTAPTPTISLIVSNINPSVVGQAVTFAASVGTTGAFPSIPAGTVTFLDGTTSLGTATLDANGNAMFSISTLTAGTHPITVSYGGSTIAATSVSAVLSQVVQTSLSSAGTGFLLNTDTNALTVNVGGSAVANLTVIELNGFNEPVTLTCSGLPTEATCAFDQSVIPAAGGTTRLVVSAAAPHNCNDSTPYFTAQSGSTALPLLAFALVGFLARRRRVLKGLVLAAALCILPALSGCSSACTDLATRPGTYTVTVTGTSAGSTPVSKSQTLTVTVVIPQSGS